VLQESLHPSVILVKDSSTPSFSMEDVIEELMTPDRINEQREHYL